MQRDQLEVLPIARQPQRELARLLAVAATAACGSENLVVDTPSNRARSARARAHVHPARGGRRALAPFARRSAPAQAKKFKNTSDGGSDRARASGEVDETPAARPDDPGGAEQPALRRAVVVDGSLFALIDGYIARRDAPQARCGVRDGRERQGVVRCVRDGRQGSPHRRAQAENAKLKACGRRPATTTPASRQGSAGVEERVRGRHDLRHPHARRGEDRRRRRRQVRRPAQVPK